MTVIQVRKFDSSQNTNHVQKDLFPYKKSSILKSNFISFIIIEK